VGDEPHLATAAQRRPAHALCVGRGTWCHRATVPASTRPGTEEPGDIAPLPRPIVLGLSAWTAATLAVWAVVPFVAAGTWRAPALWAHGAAVVAGLLVHGRHVARRNPGIRARRRTIGGNTKRWDLAWIVVFWPLMAAIAVTAGLDHGAHGGATLPGPAWLAGIALLAGALAVSARAMAANPFFEGTVRLQRDAGQRVVDGGPYGIVRHPGYLGLAGWALASPFLLLSASAIVPALAAAAWVVLRTALEDAMLRRELDGYAAYARRVRWRLVPGLW
jgi:protein-S-isoprenylcysteine O-methyltransferase Ste14